ncbi:VirD4-like conjugal transfer protein, CD1115 family [Priestia endophytica]
MKQNIDKGTLLVSVIMGLMIALVADLFLLSFFTNFPANHSMDDVVNGVKKPFELLELAKVQDMFLPLQVAALAAGVFLSYKLYKLFVGNGKYKDASNYGAHGTSRFAKESEVFNDKDFVRKTFSGSAQKNLKNTPGLIFGTLNKRPIILPENTKIPNRNVFIVGSPGSGKTQSYILTNLIFEKNRSMVITDPKGEIYEATAQLKKEQGYEVHLINFKEMLVSDRYNPIDYITKEVEAEQVANTIVINSMQGQKPDFWTKAEIALLKTLLLYVKEECPGDATLATVKHILTVHGATPEDMDKFFARLEPEHPAFSAYQIVRMASDKVRDSIFVSLAITLSKFDAKDVRKFTETSDFQLDDIGRKKMIVYVVLPVADSTWEPLTANFFTQMFQRLYDVADKNFNKLPVPVNLFLDEFPNLGTIPGYEEILATCRSYGISSSTIIQSLGQLIDKYSKEKAEAIIGNCSLRYLLGVGDKLTAEYFSELIGKTTISTHSTSVSKNSKGGSDSKSDSYTGRNLLTPDELTRMDRSEAILLVSGGYSIKLKKSFQFNFFKGILNDDNKTSRFDYLNLMSSNNNVDIEQNKVDEEVTIELDKEVEDLQIEESKKEIAPSKEDSQEGFTLEDLVQEEDYKEPTKIEQQEPSVQETIMQNIDSVDGSIRKYDEKVQNFENQMKESERKAEEERKVEAERKAEEERKVEAERKAEEERKAEAERKAEEERKAEVERKAEEGRKAEVERKAEEEHKTDEDMVLSIDEDAFGSDFDPKDNDVDIDELESWLGDEDDKKKDSLEPTVNFNFD